MKEYVHMTLLTKINKSNPLESNINKIWTWPACCGNKHVKSQNIWPREI